MTATTEGRNTKRRNAEQFSYPVATATTILVGTIVCLSATGYATPGAIATTHKTVGVAEETVVNIGADGALAVPVRRGCFQFANSASGDLITLADVGANCYVVDNQTVAKTSNT